MAGLTEEGARSQSANISHLLYRCNTCKSAHTDASSLAACRMPNARKRLVGELHTHLQTHATRVLPFSYVLASSKVVGAFPLAEFDAGGRCSVRCYRCLVSFERADENVLLPCRYRPSSCKPWPLDSPLSQFAVSKAAVSNCRLVRHSYH